MNLVRALCVMQFAVLIGHVAASFTFGQEAESSPSETTAEVLSSTKWQVLHMQGRRVAKPLPLPEDSPLKTLDQLQFSGPMPGHPFDLGDYAADAGWQLVNGYIIPDGKQAALQVGFADQFELEGILDASGLGGWFILVGWDQGRGYAISNVTMRTAESGSPWFITAFRSDKAIDGEHHEFGKLEWKGEQPFKVIVRNKTFSMQIGRTVLFNEQPLESYAPGAVILATYDTRYGPRKLRIKSLRIRAIEEKPAAAKPESQR